MDSTLNKNMLDIALGSGLKYPEMFSPVRGSSEIVIGVEKVKQSIADILETRIGERVMNPEYGSRLYEIVFEQNDFIARDLAVLYSEESLDRWEDRIIIESIDAVIPDDIQERGHYIKITIQYRYNRTNIKDSYTHLLMKEGG